MGTRPASSNRNVCKNLFYPTREINILIEGQYVRFSFFITKSDLDRVSGLNFPDDPLLIVARGIASSPLWSMMPGAELFVRLSPPEISVMGDFDPADITRLKALAFQMKHALRSLRFVRYNDIEEDCRVLASRLEDLVGRDQLRKYYFTCLPRGGLVVLGILSYVLGLERWQLEPPPTRDAPVVVIDDCALSGKRFFEFLRKDQSDTVIFAPLYSSPHLRSAIETREDRVRACISARDLENCIHSSDEEQRAFEEVFKSDASTPHYWKGLTEYLCFSWNEPDFVFFNTVTNKMEWKWTLFPQEICLKSGPVRIPVSVRQNIRTEFTIAKDVISIHEDTCVTIENLVTHYRYQVKGIAAEMWNALMECGTQEALLEKFYNEYDIDRVTLKRDVTDFIQDLLSQGILKPYTEDSSSSP